MLNGRPSEREWARWAVEFGAALMLSCFRRVTNLNIPWAIFVCVWLQSTMNSISLCRFIKANHIWKLPNFAQLLISHHFMPLSHQAAPSFIYSLTLSCRPRIPFQTTPSLFTKIFNAHVKLFPQCLINLICDMTRRRIWCGYLFIFCALMWLWHNFGPIFTCMCFTSQKQANKIENENENEE